MGDIIRKVHSVDGIMNEIVATSQTRNARMQELKQSMDAMENVTQQNAAAEQSASAAVELQSEADALHRIVDHLERVVSGRVASATQTDLPPSPAPAIRAKSRTADAARRSLSKVAVSGHQLSLTPTT